MNNNLKYFSILVVISLLLNIPYTRGEKVLSNKDTIINAKKDQYYLIYFNNTYDEFKIFSNLKNRKRQESYNNVLSFVDKIHNLIAENKHTYENPKILDKIEEKSKLKKRSNNSQQFFNYGNSELIYPISSVGNRVVFYSFLSYDLYKKVKTLNNVIECTTNKYSVSINSYYNKEDILKETKWNKLSVRENADLHLSLISQGIYNTNIINKYDNNYYYPSSAGKDVDIVIMDSSFNFDYSEFENTNDRIAKCVAHIEDGKPVIGKCGSCDYYHGEQVADTAGGLKHGVANLANIYGIAISSNENGEYLQSDILSALQFIYEKLIRPNKTVVNISSGNWQYEKDNFFIQYQEIVDKITKKGGIVVTSAGNDREEINPEINDLYYIPCSFNNTICVGSTISYNVSKYNRSLYKN
ncbi:subtilisin-like protein [Piromyces finnis]|uniref:Subtilisin-like protein n=1 Tax=Piromyces finnis TaxID=1754191 RepID=A0A1Y1U674_9FUNG|nr:subtilisin-like protein [Piromyces finnis]|eukprot:ORX33540.1 subtilisin-like protein [Piromyces finnis]